MKPEEAKEILYELIRINRHVAIPGHLGAMKQGIEAIQRLEDWRSGKVLNPHLMLPSETE